MRTEYVHPASVTPEVLLGLQESFVTEGLSYEELKHRIEQELLRVFVIGSENSRCFVAVSVLQTGAHRELQLDGLWVETPGTGWRFKTYLDVLKQLGREWGCDRVSTAVRNARQLKGLLHDGCKVDYIAVYLEIEDEHQENSNHH